MAIAGFVMGIIALTNSSSTSATLTTPILKHPGAANLGAAPTASAASSPSGFTTASIVSGSTDTSGSVEGTVTSGGTAGLITVTFGTAYATAPKGVVVTPSSATLYTAGALAVESFSATGFVVRGTPTSPVALTDKLFYYAVL